MPNLIRWGGTISVNTQTTDSQSKPGTIGLADGSFLVVWQTASTAGDGSLGAIKGQRYTSSGYAIGSEFLVNTAAAGNQIYVRAAALQSGGFVLTWETTDTLQDGSGTAVKAQLFDSAGAKLGAEFLVNTATSLDQQQPTVAALADGGFVVAWHTTDTTQDGSGWAVKAQRFDSAGVKVGAEFLVNSTAFGSQNDVDVAGLSNGGYVVTWQTGGGGNADIFARAYDSAGVPLGSQFMVSTNYASEIGGRVTALPGGGFVVTWSTLGGSVTGIRSAIYDSNAVKVGSEIAVNTTAGGGSPDVTALSDGGFLVSWSYTGTSTGVRAQQFSSAGVKVGSELLIATQANSILTDVAITGLTAGGFVVGWSQGLTGVNGYDIRAQRYLPEDTPNAAPELGDPTLSVTRGENGTSVAVIPATDDNGPVPVAYSIIGGADRYSFSFGNTGVLNFWAPPNFEAPTDSNGDNVYEVIVQASDGQLTDTKTVTVTVTNVNEAPYIITNGGGATAALSRQENAAAVTTVGAVDPESGALTFSISGGVDAARFAINAATGVLTFIAAPNFETPTDSDQNNTYLVTVRTTDGVLADTQALTVTVTNQAEAPVISSNGGGDTGTVTVGENGNAVTNVVAADPELAAVTYSINGGADAARFAINASTGALSFVAAPNYEAPADSNGDNVYQVVVRASDGTLADQQTLSVTVGNVVEGVAITSDGGGATAALGLDENGTAVTNVVAVNGEAGAPSYSIAGGADSALFSIDVATGALAFLAAPDYETPADSNADNAYEVVVAAGNGTFTDTQALTVTVLDLEEGGGGFAAFEPGGYLVHAHFAPSDSLEARHFV